MTKAAVRPRTIKVILAIGTSGISCNRAVDDCPTQSSNSGASLAVKLNLKANAGMQRAIAIVLLTTEGTLRSRKRW